MDFAALLKLPDHDAVKSIADMHARLERRVKLIKERAVGVHYFLALDLLQDALHPHQFALGDSDALQVSREFFHDVWAAIDEHAQDLLGDWEMEGTSYLTPDVQLAIKVRTDSHLGAIRANVQRCPQLRTMEDFYEALCSLAYELKDDAGRINELRPTLWKIVGAPLRHLK